MTDPLFIVATLEELRLLTKKERDVYEMFRHQGLTKEKICEELGITTTTLRTHWSRAVNKIKHNRLVQQNPQAFMLKDGVDILTNKKAVILQEPAILTLMEKKRKPKPKY